MRVYDFDLVLREATEADAAAPRTSSDGRRSSPRNVQGILEVRPDGYGFLRTNGYLPGANDVYVARSQIQRLTLRTGDFLKGLARPPKHSSEDYSALLQVEEVNGRKPEDLPAERPVFDKLPTPSPNERLRLEWNPAEPIGRILDLLAPIGKGRAA